MILSFPIKKSETLYSDFGAIRAQLEFEKKYNKSLYAEVSKLWAAEVCSWVDLNKKISRSLNTGYRKNDKINGEVHDPNAFVVKEKDWPMQVFFQQ